MEILFAGMSGMGLEDIETWISDSHAHILSQAFDQDVEGVIDRAEKAGVSLILNIGSGYGERGRKEVIELYRRNPSLIPSVGIHPHEAKDEGIEGTIALKEFLQKNIGKIHAIGETGLDFYYGRERADIQETVFREQIRLAMEFDLPLIIHMREAEERVYEILCDMDCWKTGIIFHCFSADASFAKKVLRHGSYISIGGVVTFKNARKMVEVTKVVPPSQLLVETDAPFLAPEPLRGKRNEPSFIPYIVRKVAEIKGLTPMDVARVTTYNLQKVLRLPKKIEGDTLVYRIRDSIYLNITNRCTLNCTFCPKRDDYMVMGYNLKLKREPTLEEIIDRLRGIELKDFKEVVFCGFGEPSLRLDILKDLATYLKKRGIKVRLDTDGLANLVYKRNILPELQGLIDAISVSINAGTAEEYEKICPSRYGKKAFYEVQKFILEAKRYIPDVTATAVDLPEIDIEKAKRLVEDILKTRFRVRRYNFVG